MRWAVLYLVAGLVLVGCTPDGGGPTGAMGSVTRDQFLAAMGTDGAVNPPEWVALEYMGEDPPMDGILIDAMADPFATDAGWMRPEAKAERTAMLGKLTEWWKIAKGPKLADAPHDQVASRFSMVVSARILMARLQYAEESNKSVALNSAVETMELARAGFVTAPGMVCADLMPSVVMAAEALARIGEEAGGQPEAYEAALSSMRFSIFEHVAGSVKAEFFMYQLQMIVEQMNRSDQAASVLNVVDPMGDSEEPINKIEMALKGKKPVDLRQSAEMANGLLNRFAEPPKDFGVFAELYDASVKDVTSIWGENLFEVRPEGWGTVSASDNAAGVIYLAAAERKWLTAIESSYMMQMNLDAARLRLSNTMLARDLVNEERDALVDPLTGGKYDIDMQNEVLRTTLKEVDSKFIFVNQIVQAGVPLRR